MKIRTTLVLASLGLLLVAGGPAIERAAADHCATLVATLSGPAINGVTPSGRADWRGNLACNLGLELKVEVRDVNLPDGTILTFESCVDPNTGLFPFRHNFTLKGRAGSFQLKRADGDSVPRCDRDTGIRILNGGTTILSGVWCAPVVRRCD